MCAFNAVRRPHFSSNLCGRLSIPTDRSCTFSSPLFKPPHNYVSLHSIRLSAMTEQPPLLSPVHVKASSSPPKHRGDFLIHLEAYLAKRDGVDKLLKISRYASRVILASSFLPETLPLRSRLKSFESTLGVSRKAFRLGKFIQNINALRATSLDSRLELVLFCIANGGEGLYYFLEQYTWLAKSGLIAGKYSPTLEWIGTLADCIGYFGSISLTIRDLRRIYRDEASLNSKIGFAMTSGLNHEDESKQLRILREQKLLNKLSLVQDLSDCLMVFADIHGGKGKLPSPLLLSCGGLLSGLISTHRNWVSC